MTLFGGERACWRYLDMARELKPSRTRPRQKRPHGSALYHSWDLDYELYREDFPYRVYDYQKIPPLINRIPVKARRAHPGPGGKSRLSPPAGSRGGSSAAVGRTKLRAEELHSIKGELSQIKAQVDSLLESLDRMDQRRERPGGERGSKEGEEPSSPVGATLQEPWGKESPAGEVRSGLRDIDSAEESTDTEEMKNHASEPEGSQ
ncbi:RNA-binding Raly-like protein isoform X2 [Carettochelys insculpta]|uniref:RNA-binding Raly-like protein isoform X2 n=1 Tax=Carettochelys insculpta TaxID=44489 RepID=UPI003EC02A34